MSSNEVQPDSASSIYEILLVLGVLGLFGLLVLAGNQSWPLAITALTASPALLLLRPLRKFIDILRSGDDQPDARVTSESGSEDGGALSATVLGLLILLLMCGAAYGFGAAVALIAATA